MEIYQTSKCADFQRPVWQLLAKEADFGYSTPATSDDDLILMPNLGPWMLPNISSWIQDFWSDKTDAYSFGMLCFWPLFFKENERYLKKGILEELKSNDELRGLSHQFIMTATSLNDEERCNLDLFFNSTLVRDPKRRNLDFKQLLQLLMPNKEEMIKS